MVHRPHHDERADRVAANMVKGSHVSCVVVFCIVAYPSGGEEEEEEEGERKENETTQPKKEKGRRQ